MKPKEPVLTERDLDLLTDLYTHSLLSSRHLAVIHCTSDGHRRRLRRRVQILREAGYVARLNTPIDKPHELVLTQRGMNALANHRSMPPRSISIPRSDRQFRSHDIALSDFTLALDLHIRAQPNATMIDELALIHRSPRLDVRSHRGWQVTFSHDGDRHTHWVKPDRFLGVWWLDRPKNRNARYFAIELDRGTMPLRAGSLAKASILRKLLAYQATFVDDVLRDTFVIPHAYTLFLTTGSRRRDNMARLAQEVVTNDRAAQSMLFGETPPPPRLGHIIDPTTIEWINGRGEAVTLPM